MPLLSRPFPGPYAPARVLQSATGLELADPSGHLEQDNPPAAHAADLQRAIPTNSPPPDLASLRVVAKQAGARLRRRQGIGPGDALWPRIESAGVSSVTQPRR